MRIVEVYPITSGSTLGCLQENSKGADLLRDKLIAHIDTLLAERTAQIWVARALREVEDHSTGAQMATASSLGRFVRTPLDLNTHAIASRSSDGSTRGAVDVGIPSGDESCVVLAGTSGTGLSDSR